MIFYEPTWDPIVEAEKLRQDRVRLPAYTL